jgi:hypothetical protein
MSEETIPQMREQIDSLSKELKTLRATNTDLEKAKRVLTTKDIFRNEGYSPSHAELFVSMNPEGDVTKEAIVEFVGQYGLVAEKTSEEGQEVSNDEGSETGNAPGSEDLATMSRGGSGSGEGSAGGAVGKDMTRQEWQRLYAQNPAEAQNALRQGRVQFSDSTPVPSGVNPYATSEVLS